MIEINFSPTRTSKNYGLNSFCLPNDCCAKPASKFNSVFIDGDCVVSNLTSKPHFLIDEKANAKSKIVLQGKHNFASIKFEFDNLNNSLAEHFEIVVEQNTNAVVVVRLNAKIKCFHNGYFKLKVAQNAKLQFVVVSNLQKATSAFKIDADVSENAEIEVIEAILSNEICTVQNNINLCKATSKGSVVLCYFASGDAQIDMNVLQNVFGEHCFATTQCFGALSGKASKSFRGAIDFKRGARFSTAEENDECVMLSPFAKSKSLPVMLCHEEQVQGSHASATGEVDKTKLFYLMTRGFDKKQAELMIVLGKIKKMLKTVKDENIKNQIVEMFERI